MSQVKVSGNASGTGVLTIAAPNTNTDYTLTLPAETGTVLTSGGAIDVNASAPADSVAIDSSGNVGIGTTSPSGKLHVVGNETYFQRPGDTVYLRINTANGAADLDAIGGVMRFRTDTTERMRIDSSGNVLVGTTTVALADATSGSGIALQADGQLEIANTGVCARFNRSTSDGTLVEFRESGVTEGTISVSGSTVSYNGGHLSRWAQMLTKPDLLKGTVMSNLDEMNVYIAPTTYWTEEDELPEGVNVGDVKVETHEVQNEQLNKVKVSDVEGDANVAGVFVNWTYDEAHSVDEINMAMTGDMIIRIAQGVTVQRGDLLMSAGDGTAKPQGDDIVRSKTVAKVTSTHVTCTYEDGSYCVPCVLMAC
jgi:hypothetical protein